MTADAVIAVTFQKKAEAHDDNAKQPEPDKNGSKPAPAPHPDNGGGNTPSPHPGNSGNNNSGNGGTPSEKETGKTYTVKFSAHPLEGGTVSAKTETGAKVNNGDTLPENTKIIFTAKSAGTDDDNRYYINSWSGTDGLQVEASNKQTASLMLTADATITVNFSKIDVQGTNWRAAGKIKDSNDTEHAISLLINDNGQYLTISIDGDVYFI